MFCNSFKKKPNNFSKSIVDDTTFNVLDDQIKALSRDIMEDKSVGRGFRIGHSYFCG